MLELKPQSYSSKRSFIAYVISLLSGQVREWGTAVWGKKPKLCVSYSTFTEEPKVLLLLIEFCTIAAESGWNDIALQGVFYRGLHDQLKDELATRNDIASLDQLISNSIRLDNRLRERR